MPHVPAPHRPNRPALLAGVLAAVVAGLGLAPTGALAQTTTSPSTTKVTPANAAVVRLKGQMTMQFDPSFVATLKRSKATVGVRSGATYSGKTRTATLPVDSNALVLFSTPAIDIAGSGTIVLRRPDRRKVTMQSLTMRVRSNGAELASTIRKRSGRVFGLLTISPSTDVISPKPGVRFANLQMLVSNDLVRAAREAKIKGLKEGALLGLLTVEVSSQTPTIQIPSLTNLGTSITVPGLDLSKLPTIPGLDLSKLPTVTTTPGATPSLDLSKLPQIPGLDLTNLPKVPNLDVNGLLALLGIDPTKLQLPAIELPKFDLPTIPGLDLEAIRQFLAVLGIKL